MRILLLTAGFGDGHNTAVRGLREAFDKLGEGLTVETVDVLRRAYGPFNAIACKAYHGLIIDSTRIVGLAPLCFSLW